MKHTPTPWYIDDNYYGALGEQWPDRTVAICGQPREAVELSEIEGMDVYVPILEIDPHNWMDGDEIVGNLNFVFRAVNAHDQLVEALENIAVAPCIYAMLGEEPLDEFGEPMEICPCPGCRARAALAAAEDE